MSIDAISIITALDGRGVNLGTVNVQPLLGVVDGASRALIDCSNFKHEFGHAFQRFGDHYTSDFLLEEMQGRN